MVTRGLQIPSMPLENGKGPDDDEGRYSYSTYVVLRTRAIGYSLYSNPNHKARRATNGTHCQHGAQCCNGIIIIALHASTARFYSSRHNYFSRLVRAPQLPAEWSTSILSSARGNDRRSSAVRRGRVGRKRWPACPCGPAGARSPRTRSCGHLGFGPNCTWPWSSGRPARRSPSGAP